MKRFLFVVAAAMLALPAFGGTVSAQAAGASCHASAGGLPDPKCTPGATNPAVTQQNIQSTICKAGWTASVRPKASYTDRLKKQQMAAYGDTGSPGSYEEDHLIPLELGGAPRDGANLWPEPGGLPSPNNKDRVEDAARDTVCSGGMSLTAAQQAMASSWIQLGQQLGTIPKPTLSPTPTPTPTPSPTATPTPQPAATAPPPVAAPAPPAPAAPSDPNAQLRAQGVSAVCRDGSYSSSTHREGTCSHHGGVQEWTGLI